MKKLALLISFLILTAPAFADAPYVSVTNAWARPTIGTNLISAIYLDVKNDGKEPVELLSVSTPSGAASLHESMEHNGMMHMEPLSTIKIASGETVSFTPGHKHIMLEGLKAPLKEGDKISLMLNFSGNSAKMVDVPVADKAEEKPSPLTEQQATERLQQSKPVYSCGMKPTWFSPEPGQCPCCTMPLEKVKEVKDGKAVFESGDGMQMDMKDMPMKDMKMMESE